MKIIKRKNHFLGILILLSLIACDKGFFEDINNDALVVPTTITDMQAMMDNTIVMNGGIANSGAPLPVLGESSTDDFYFTDTRVNAFRQVARELYLWSPEYVDDEQTLHNWIFPYKTIMYCNIVLDNLKKSGLESTPQVDNIEGSAKFFRAYVYFHLAQNYAAPFGKDAAASLGLPMRMISDISVPFSRLSLSETYQMILDDANSALNLLPETPKYKTRPSKTAVYALLAKIYLVMGDFEKAGKNATAALALQSKMMDFNKIDPNLEYPIPVLNDEVIFHINMVNSNVSRTATVSDQLYEMYTASDLRKGVFFSTKGAFKGSYSSSATLFGGLTTSESILIAAECDARLGNYAAAREKIETLRINRIKQKDYRELMLNDHELIKAILAERRKELVLRGVTWSDLRRLNQEPEYSRSMFRNYNNTTYELTPNSSCYTFLIPAETQFPTGTPQNKR